MTGAQEPEITLRLPLCDIEALAIHAAGAGDLPLAAKLHDVIRQWAHDTSKRIDDDMRRRLREAQSHTADQTFRRQLEAIWKRPLRPEENGQ